MKLWVQNISCVINFNSYILQISSVVLTVCQLCNEQSCVNDPSDCVEFCACWFQCKLPLECNFGESGQNTGTLVSFCNTFFHDSLWLPKPWVATPLSTILRGWCKTNLDLIMLCRTLDILCRVTGRGGTACKAFAIPLLYLMQCVRYRDCLVQCVGYH